MPDEANPEWLAHQKKLARQRNQTREVIVHLALQIARLKKLGTTVDSEGIVVKHAQADVTRQIEAQRIQLEQEAEFLLSQLSIGGDEKEDTN